MRQSEGRRDKAIVNAHEIPYSPKLRTSRWYSTELEVSVAYCPFCLSQVHKASKCPVVPVKGCWQYHRSSSNQYKENAKALALEMSGVYATQRHQITQTIA